MACDGSCYQEAAIRVERQLREQHQKDIDDLRAENEKLSALLMDSPLLANPYIEASWKWYLRARDVLGILRS